MKRYTTEEKYTVAKVFIIFLLIVIAVTYFSENRKIKKIEELNGLVSEYELRIDQLEQEVAGE
ncbi:MAG: hypothetical protein J6Z35_09220 [Lachnospiraceae bacterium]|nr:hypothetical protein [Lachnospiraceae bacterium]